MTKQSRLIGEHPDISQVFGKWLSINDVEATRTKCHRELTEKSSFSSEELSGWLARKLIDHHYSDFRLNRLKEKYKELGYEEYAEQHRKLPVADKVKKGNATEIILTEYVEECLKKELAKVYKLKYNPNVNQAIKGDDTLMVELLEQGENIKIYLGESKFRKIPSKAAVDDISNALDKDKKPLSYSFLIEELAKSDETLELAEKLDKFIVDEVKDKGNLVYIGLLLSNPNTSKYVENHLNNDNPTLVFVSIGIEDPEKLIEQAFIKAEDLIAQPEVL